VKCLTFHRFFIHRSIQRLANDIIQKYGTSKESAILLHSLRAAQRCVSFIRHKSAQSFHGSVYVLELSAGYTEPEKAPKSGLVSPNIWACVFPADQFTLAKEFWQHTGEGISSRRAEYCQSLFSASLLICKQKERQRSDSFCKGPKRYQKKEMADSDRAQGAGENDLQHAELLDFNTYVEERFGRNLDISLSSDAKKAIRRRIAGSLVADVDLKQALELESNQQRPDLTRNCSEEDVYLYPGGMNAIFNTHQTLLAAVGSHRSICYGLVNAMSGHL
jgi:cystathionine gamma-synthase